MCKIKITPTFLMVMLTNLSIYSMDTSKKDEKNIATYNKYPTATICWHVLSLTAITSFIISEAYWPENMNKKHLLGVGALITVYLSGAYLFHKTQKKIIQLKKERGKKADKINVMLQGFERYMATEIGLIMKDGFTLTSTLPVSDQRLILNNMLRCNFHSAAFMSIKKDLKLKPPAI